MVKLSGRDTKFDGKDRRGNTAGRPVGSKNRYTRILREAAIIAAEIEGDRLAKEKKMKQEGLIAYLVNAARYERKAYLGFLGKILPMQGHLQVEMHKQDTYETAEEIDARLREKGTSLEVFRRLLLIEGSFKDVTDKEAS
jgi:hypothetical protein